MPGVPIEMPSDTVMVLNSTLLPPAASTPAAASRASSPMCMLQGVTLLQVEATPICGLAKSSSRKPVARSIARAGACFTPSITTREFARGSGLFFTSPLQRKAHAPKTQCPDGRHGERQQQGELTCPVAPCLQPHVGQHARRRRQSAPHSGERDMHAHVVLRAADRGEVIVPEIPAKVSTGL